MASVVKWLGKGLRLFNKIIRAYIKDGIKVGHSLMQILVSLWSDKVFHNIVSKGSKKSLTGTMSVKDAAMIVTGKANV